MGLRSFAESRRGSEVPQSANACDENLPRRTGIIARHGLHTLVIEHRQGGRVLRYLKSGETPSIPAPTRRSPDFVGPRRPNGKHGPRRLP